MERDELRALEQSLQEIWEAALRLGLDPFPTHFEVVPANIMYEFGAYGLPGSFSHWTHGRAYQQIKTLYDYGLSKIYELVINTNPAYAFLLDSNSTLQNKLVAAHVLAHSDFFKNNVYFQPTSRQMLETASVDADRIRHYEFVHGREEVEPFLDAVLSIQEHVDPHRFIRRDDNAERHQQGEERSTGSTFDLLDLDKPRIPKMPPAPHRVPAEPEKDLLLFIVEHAPHLEDWQRDIIHIVRQEQLYFIPQMQTKIMNEGWASFWHARIMRELNLSQEEYVHFATLHASVLAPGLRRINPYHVGMRIFEDILRRWDSPTEEEQRKFGRKPGQGMAKIFEVRELENDVSFLRNYLTRDLVVDLDLFVYRLEDDKWVITEKEWENVRDALVASLTNFGHPYIVVEDGDYNRYRELYLRHSYEGHELDLNYAEKTLHYIHQLWGRTVHLETVVDGKVIILTSDGNRARVQAAESAAQT